MTIADFVKAIRGRKCVACIGGSGAGSVIGLGIGNRLRRVRPLKNPTLSEIDKNNATEFELTVFCAWRMSREQRVICAWRDASESDTWKQLSAMIGRKIVSAEVHPHFYDLTIVFEGEIVFDVFCDVTTDEEDENNYIFSDDSYVSSVDANFEQAKPERRMGVFSAT